MWYKLWERLWDILGVVAVAAIIVASLLYPRCASAQPFVYDVGVAGSEPFVVEDTRLNKVDQIPTYKGIAPEVFEKMVKSFGVGIPRDTFHTKRYASVHEMIEALDRGEIQIAIGPISVTAARAQKNIVFTQPYYRAGLGILAAEDTSLWTRVKPFFQKTFWYGFLFFIVVLHIVGVIMWYVERKKNPEHFDPSWKGIFGGAWFAIVTMTTVGYGDKSPQTLVGRIVTSGWMLFTMIMMSSLTAFLTTALVTQTHDPGDLKGQRVAAVEGTTGVSFCQARDAHVRPEKSLTSAVEALKDGEVDAVVFDAPALQYWLAQNPGSGYALVAQPTSEDYAFAVNAEYTHLLPLIDASIIQLKEQNKIEEVKSRWLSEI